MNASLRSPLGWFSIRMPPLREPRLPVSDLAEYFLVVESGEEAFCFVDVAVLLLDLVVDLVDGVGIVEVVAF